MDARLDDFPTSLKLFAFFLRRLASTQQKILQFSGDLLLVRGVAALMFRQRQDDDCSTEASTLSGRT